MRLLLIEDEEKLAKYIRRGLQEQGFMIEVCHTIQEAKDFIDFQHNIIDLIILDLMLPDGDGMEVCRYAHKQNLTIPILVLTAKTSTKDIIFSLNTGADDYLTKPFSFEVLVARIRALLRRPSVIRNERVKIRDLILDSYSRKVFVQDQEIELTSKEYLLLEYFMHNPNKVIDREAILEKVWDLDTESFSNVIDVHIKNLRKKLAKYQTEAFLKTVRGMGYVLKT